MFALNLDTDPFNNVLTAVRQASDIMADGTQDTTKMCDGISVGLWPEQYGDLHELQGGERKTHTFAFCAGPDTVTDDPLFWVRSPLLVVADPSASCAAEAVAPLRAGNQQSRAGYAALVNVAIDKGMSFRERRECIDEFGWRNFGELYADHESVGSDTPLVSHYNNQYDALAGLIARFLATGERRWWTLADELANHVNDIDLYHTRGDRSAYSGDTCGSFKSRPAAYRFKQASMRPS